MNQDEYGEVLNGSSTYHFIGISLKFGGKVLFGWTDGFGSHFDILMTYGISGIIIPEKNHLQGGIKDNDLFVSIMRVGAFGFEVNESDIHWNYYNEKLGGIFGPTTGEKLAELINNVKKELCR